MTYTGQTGFKQGAAPNYESGIMMASNVDLSGILPPGQIGNCFSADGQLLIGSTTVGAGGTHVKIGNITSADGSISVTNGPGTIDLRGISNSLCPNDTIILIDDFFPQNGTDPSAPGQLMWDVLGGSTSTISNNPNHPGVIAIPSVASADSGIMLSRSSNNGPFITVGGGPIQCSFNFDLVALSTVANRYTAFIGFGDNTSNADPTNGIFFSYSDNVNSGNWVLNCRKAGVTTSVNTSTPAATGFNTFTIVTDATASSITFYINGTLVGSAITTNIPTVAISPEFGLTWTSGNTPQMQIDLFWFYQTLNNPRPGNCAVSPGVVIPTFAPNATLQEFDDFLGDISTSNQIVSKLSWNTIGNHYGFSNGTTAHPGILELVPQVGQPTGIWLYNTNSLGNDTAPIVLGGGITTVSWVVKLTGLSAGGNTYRFTTGLADTTTLLAPADNYVNGVYFSYTGTVNTGQWQIKSTNTSVTTTVNTTVAADTNFHTFTIVANAAASSISYYIDNALVGTAISTNIPTAALNPFCQAINTAGTTPAINIDLFWIKIDLTNPRPGPAPISGSTGRLIENYRSTAISTTVTIDDAIIGVTDTSAARTITMPAVPSFLGQEWTIKDESVGAATNNITISGNGHNIVGTTSAATYVITTNGGAVTLYWNGTTFQVV